MKNEPTLKDLGLDDPVTPPKLATTPTPASRPQVQHRPVARTTPPRVVNRPPVALDAGWLVMFVGAVVTAFFVFVYDTTSGEVYNVGLQQNRLIGTLLGIAIAGAGVFAVGLSSVVRSR